MSVQNLIQSALQDGARSTKFNLELRFSTQINSNEWLTQQVPMQIKASTFPARGHQRTDLKYQGRIIPLRGQIRYNNSWACTFYLTTDHKLKKVFEDWINGLDEVTHFEGNVSSDLQSVINAHNKTGYSVDMIIKQVDFSESKETCEYVIHNVFPVEVGPVQVSYEGPGRILEFDVTFTYSYWEATVTNG